MEKSNLRRKKKMPQNHRTSLKQAAFPFDPNSLQTAPLRRYSGAFSIPCAGPDAVRRNGEADGSSALLFAASAGVGNN